MTKTRYYDQLVGTFLSADTVQGNLLGNDPYAYVNGNPETNSDPTGHAYIPACNCGGGSSSGPQNQYQQTPAGPSPFSDPCTQTGGCKLGSWVDTGSSTVQLKVSGTFSCQGGIGLSMGGVLGFSIGGCVPGFSGGSIVTYRANNPPANVQLCVPTIICIEDEHSDSSDAADAQSDETGNLTFASADGEGGAHAQPQETPPEKTQAGQPESQGDTTTVYRVQGGSTPKGGRGSRNRISVTPGGDIQIEGDQMLHLNFGDWDRAMQWLDMRGEGSVLVSFEVKNSFLDAVKELSVPQAKAYEFPGFPQIDDPKFADQYGIPSGMFDWLLESTIPGSGSVTPYSVLRP